MEYNFFKFNGVLGRLTGLLVTGACPFFSSLVLFYLNGFRRQPPFDGLVVEERRRCGLKNVERGEAVLLAVVEDDRPPGLQLLLSEWV